MYLLTIVFGPTPTPWALLFKDVETADVAYAKLEKPDPILDRVSILDDFGQRVNIRSSTIHSFMLEDMEQSKMAHIERGLHQARTQARAQQMAVGDPVLKSTQMMRGPAMLNPMGNGPFN